MRSLAPVAARCCAALTACLCLAACSQTGSPSLDLQPAVQQPQTAGLAFPADKQTAGLTEDVLLGKEAGSRSAGTMLYGDSLIIGSSSSTQAQHALYRFNLGAPELDSLLVDLQPAGTAAAYIALANQTAQRWELRGPFQTPQSLIIDAPTYVSPAGNLWVAVIAPQGKQAILRQLKARHYQPGPPDNIAPDAQLAVDTLSGFEPLTVNFDASASTDPDGGIVLYEWDWDGDSVYDESSASPQLSHTFVSTGIYQMRMRVRDEFGLWDTETRSITVNPRPPNLLPYAAFTFNPATGSAPLEVDFDAGTSSDNDGDILLYEWDWEDDGSYDDFGPTPLATHTFTTSGWHNPRLRVTDDRSGQRTAAANWKIGVGPYWQPVVPGPQPSGWSSGAVATGLIQGLPTLALAPSSGNIRLIKATDASGSGWAAETIVPASASTGTVSLATVGGRPALSYVNNYELRYLAAQDAAGTAWNAQVVVGNANIRRTTLLEVGGVPAIIYVTYSSPAQVRCIHALDSTGLAWSTPIDLGEIDSYASASAALVNGHPAVAWPSPAGSLQFSRSLDSAGDSWGTSLMLAASGVYKADLEVVAGLPAIAFTKNVASNIVDIDFVAALDADGAGWNGAVPAAIGMPTSQVSLRVIAGLPAIAASPTTSGYPDEFPMRYIPALAADGSSWDPPQVAGFGYYATLLDLAGTPAIVNSKTGLRVSMVY